MVRQGEGYGVKPGNQAHTSGLLRVGAQGAHYSTQKCCLQGVWVKLGALGIYWGLGTLCPACTSSQNLRRKSVSA